MKRERNSIRVKRVLLVLSRRVTFPIQQQSTLLARLLYNEKMKYGQRCEKREKNKIKESRNVRAAVVVAGDERDLHGFHLY